VLRFPLTSDSPVRRGRRNREVRGKLEKLAASPLLLSRTFSLSLLDNLAVLRQYPRNVSGFQHCQP